MDTTFHPSPAAGTGNDCMNTAVTQPPPSWDNAVDLGSEALASHESGEDESSLPKNNAHYKMA